MYTGFLHLHDTLRWLLLVSLVITLVKYLAGWLGNQPWKKVDNILGIVFTSLMDLQLLTGLVLYFFLSPESSHKACTQRFWWSYEKCRFTLLCSRTFCNDVDCCCSGAYWSSQSEKG